MESDVFDSKNGKVIFVCINWSYDNLLKDKKIRGRETVYDCVRKYWEIENVEKANKADFILGVYDHIVAAVFKMDKRGWRKISEDSELKEEFKNDDEMKTHSEYYSRYAFSSEKPAEPLKNSPYLGKMIPREFWFSKIVTVTYNY